MAEPAFVTERDSGVWHNASVPHILAFDEGTTSARTVLYDETGERLLMRSIPLTSMYPNPGWVEQDAEEIWSAQLRSALTVLAESQASPAGDRRHEPARDHDRLGPEDGTTAGARHRVAMPPYRRRLPRNRSTVGSQKTGLVLDAYFSATKIQWILEHRRKRARWPETVRRCSERSTRG